MCKISVAMPIFGVENYIAKSIESICKQTYRNFELLLVDDGCLDHSVETALSVLKQHHAEFPYRVIRQKNAGVSVARNTGMRSANGEWILCIDPDDYIHPQTLEILADQTEAMPDGCDCIGFDYQLVSACPDIFTPIQKAVPVIAYTQQEILKAFLLRRRILLAPALLLRKSVLDEKELWYEPSCRFSEDIHFIWRLLYSIRQFHFVELPLYYYLYRSGSTMTASGIEKILTGYQTFESFDVQLRAEHPGDDVSEMIFPRWVLGALHASSKILSYRDFCLLVDCMNGRKRAKKLFRFGDWRIALLARILFVSRYTFYSISRKI